MPHKARIDAPDTLHYIVVRGIDWELENYNVMDVPKIPVGDVPKIHEKYFGGKPRYQTGVTHKRGGGTSKQ